MLGLNRMICTAQPETAVGLGVGFVCAPEQEPSRDKVVSIGGPSGWRAPNNHPRTSPLSIAITAPVTFGQIGRHQEFGHLGAILNPPEPSQADQFGPILVLSKLPNGRGQIRCKGR